MTRGGREAQALAKLIRLARARADEVSARLVTLRAALSSNEAALAMLRDCVREESSAAKAAEIVGFVQLAGYLLGAERKRAALELTRGQLIDEIEASQTGLNEAWVELKKLEHLAERARLSDDRSRRRSENAESDELAQLAAAARRRR